MPIDLLGTPALLLDGNPKSGVSSPVEQEVVYHPNIYKESYIQTVVGNGISEPSTVCSPSMVVISISIVIYIPCKKKTYKHHLIPSIP